MPRWALQTKCAFSSLLRDLVQCQGDRDDPPSLDSGASPWPMPLPYPECFRRYDGVSMPPIWKKRLVCLQVALLDWLVLGSPSHAPRSLRLGRRLSPRKWGVIQQILHLSWDGNSPAFVSAVMMGRTAAKMETFEEQLTMIHQAAETMQSECRNSYFALVRNDQSFECESSSFRCGEIVGHAEPLNTTAAKELVPERLQFPGPFFGWRHCRCV